MNDTSAPTGTIDTTILTGDETLIAEGLHNMFRRLRREAPVHARYPGPSLETLSHDFIALGYDEAQIVFRDAETFATNTSSFFEPIMGRTILDMEGTEHSTYRSFIQQAFTRAAMQRWEQEIIGPHVERAIDRFAQRGRAELVAELTAPVPFAVIAGMFGLDDEQVEYLQDMSIDLLSHGDEQRAMRASMALRASLSEVIAQRRRHPGDDVVSALALARGPGRRLTDDEILSFLLLLLPAGGETSRRSASTLLWTLLDRPDLLDAIRREPERLRAAIEEGLRWEPPVVSITRVARKDTQLGGVDVAAGATVAACIASANRDERYWPDADRFDPDRPPRPFMTFGAGAHLCIGLHLVRAESARMVGRMIERFPNLRRDPDATWPEVSGLMLRSPATVPVVFD
jgi:cytochrome P450